jgi:hypothetical protein
MGAFNLLGLLAIIPTTGLLVVSFFVLFALGKTESQSLKTFGYVIAVCLWISASLIFSAGIYMLATGRHPMMNMMQQMMKGQMQQPMMQHQMMNR